MKEVVGPKRLLVRILASLLCAVSCVSAGDFSGGLAPIPLGPARVKEVPPVLEGVLKRHHNHVAFEAAQGQWLDEEILFRARAAGYQVRVRRDGFSTFVDFGEDRPAHVWNLTFEGASPEGDPVGRRPRSTRVNLFWGDKSFVDIPHFEEVWCENLYPKVDLRYYSKGDGQVDYDLVLRPGADAAGIRFRIDGASGLSVNDAGELLIEGAPEILRKGAPVTYQVIGGEEVPVESRYVLLDPARNLVGFALGAHDPARPVVIDPTTLIASTAFFGNNTIYDFVVDADGVWLGGRATGLSAPTTPGAFLETHSLSGAGYVAHLDHNLTNVIAMTYVGGPPNGPGGSISGWSMCRDGGDVCMFTESRNVQMPTTSNAYQSTTLGIFAQGGITHLTRLTPDLSTLVYGSYFSGNMDNERFWGANFVDGKVYMTHLVGIGAGSLVTPGAFQTTNPDGGLLFTIVEPDPALTNGEDLVYSTYINHGDNTGWADDPKVDRATGKIYLTGYAGQNFYSTPDARRPFSDLSANERDIFLMEFAPVEFLGNGIDDVLYSSAIGTEVSNAEQNLGGMEIHNGSIYIPVNSLVRLTGLPPWTGEVGPGRLGHVARMDLGTKAITGLFGIESEFGVVDVRSVDFGPCGDMYVHSRYSGGAVLELPDDALDSGPYPQGMAIHRVGPDMERVIQATLIPGGNTSAILDLGFHGGRVYAAGGGGTASSPTTPGALYPASARNGGMVMAFSTLKVEVETNAHSICAGVDFTLPAAMPCGGTAPYAFQWTVDAPAALNHISGDTTAAPTINVNSSLVLTVTVTDAEGATHHQDIDIIVSMSAEVADAGPDQEMCTGDSVVLGSGPIDSLVYVWSPAAGLSATDVAQPTASPSQTTVYTLTVTNCDGSTSTDSVTVAVDPPLSTYLPDYTDEIACRGKPVQLGPASMNNVSATWTPADGLDDATSPNPLASPLEAITYTYTLTSDCTGESVSGELTVGVNPSSANAGEDKQVCLGEATPVGNPANPVFSSYHWSFADPDAAQGSISDPTAATPLVTIANIGAHELILETESAVCGVTTDRMLVVVAPSNAVAETGLDREICVDWPDIDTWKTQALGVPPIHGQTYEWSPAVGLSATNVADPVVDPNLWPDHAPGASMTYTLVATTPCTGDRTTNTVTLTLAGDVPFVDAYDSTLRDPDEDNVFHIFCHEFPALGMDARPNVAYHWDYTDNFSIAPNFDSLEASSVVLEFQPEAVRTYTLFATHMCSGVISTDTVTCIVDCGNGGDTNLVFDPADIPEVDAGPDIAICQGEVGQLGVPNDNPDLVYTWIPTNDLSDPHVSDPLVIGALTTRVYIVVVSNTVNGAQNGDTVLVDVYRKPLASAGPPRNFACANDIDVQLGPAPGMTTFEDPNWTVQWSPTLGLDDPFALRPRLRGPVVAPTYSVTVTDIRTDCRTTAFMDLTIAATHADAGDDKEICPGSSVVIGSPAQDGVTYQWTPITGLVGSDTAQPTASPSQDTTYYLVATDSNGCEALDEVLVRVRDSSARSADAGDDLTLCASDPLATIGANSDQRPEATYRWTAVPADGTNALSATDVPRPHIDPSQLSSGVSYVFTLVITDVATSCDSTDQLTVSLLPTAPPVLSGVPETVQGCTYRSASVRGITIDPPSDDYEIRWEDASGNVVDRALNPNLPVGETGAVYTLTVVNPCSLASTSVNLTVTNYPETVIIDMGTYPPVCPGTPVQLDATTTNANWWRWSRASGQGAYVGPPASPRVEDPVYIPTTTSQLRLRTRGEGNCTVIGFVTIPVIELEIDPGPDQIVCAGEEATLGTPGDPDAFTYTWSLLSGAGPAPNPSNTAQVTVAPTGDSVYQLVVAPIGGECAGVTDTVSVVLDTGAVTAHAGRDVTNCAASCVDLGSNAVVVGYTYTWTPADGLSDPADPNPTACPDETTVYQLIVSNCAGQSATDTVTVTVNPLPSANAGPDRVLCESDAVMLGTAGDPANTYRWSPADMLDDPTAARPTFTPRDVSRTVTFLYTLTVSNQFGCPAQDEVRITVHPVAQLAYAPAEICAGESVVLGTPGSVSGLSEPHGIVWTPDLHLDDNQIDNPTATPPTNTLYTVQVTPAGGGCPETRTVWVLVDEPDLTPSITPACPGEDARLSVNSIPGATYEWLGPNGFYDTNRLVTITNVAAADYGTYTARVTTAGGCLIEATAPLYDACACDLESVIESVTDCDHDPATGESRVDLTLRLVWGSGSPSGEDILVRSAAGTVTVDTSVVTSPHVLVLSLPADGVLQGIFSSFETSRCEAYTNFPAPPPCPVRIGDYVWEDIDYDGIQETNEPPVSNVTVILLNEFGTPVATQRTDAAGHYLFDDLPAGIYSVVFEPPPGYAVTRGDVGDDALDSDGLTPPPTDLTGPRTEDLTLDLGLYRPVTVGDFVWNDLDGDGVQEAGEPGISNVTAVLYDSSGTAIATQLTDAAGQYLFEGLPPGQYSVQFTDPPGMVPTISDTGDDALDSDGNPISRVLASGEEDLTLDRGYYTPVTVGDFVWNDLDGDGVQEAGEPGISNVTAVLYDSGGTAIATQVTDAAGQYLFEGLPPGQYSVQFTDPPGMVPTISDTGDDALDSDGNPVSRVLASGEEDLTLDRGYYAPVTVGDFVWNDLDGDGVQEAGEPGISNVTAVLYDSGGTAIATQVTDAAGQYLFEGLPPGQYSVQFTDPPGMVPTISDTGDDAFDSDGNPISRVLASGEEDLTLDRGYYTPVTVGDFVWNDLDGDGVQEAGEPGISNVTAVLFDSGGTAIATQLTDAAGQYLFEGLPPGQYSVQFTDPPGMVPTISDTGDDALDSDGNPISRVLASGEEDLTLDRGYYTPVTVGDFVWNDLDGDGVQEAGEPGISNVTAVLFDSSGTAIATQTTDAAGQYLFEGLPPGQYSVQFTPPTGMVPTVSDTGDDALDSDANPVSRVLQSGDEDLTLDAGFYTPVRVGDFVWEDLDGDGVQDPGEPAVSNVTVLLYDADNNPLGFTMTDTNGFYVFDELPPGSYSVTFLPPAGYVLTTPDKGGDDALDSDADPTSGETPFTPFLTSGQEDLTLDAGLVRPVRVGDFVWEDLDKDGEQDAGEPGIPGVTVVLFDSNGVGIATQQTDGVGTYLFDNLPPGQYSVRFTDPPGYVPTLTDAAADTVDSDPNPATSATLASGEEDLTLDRGYVRLQPDIELVKTVYSGHDGGAGCPGGDLDIGPASRDVTYCFLVTNTGETHLANVTLTDTDVTPNLSTNIGPLAPGEIRWVHLETTTAGDLVNHADVIGDPAHTNGVPLGWPPVTDDDPAEVRERMPGYVLVKSVVSPTGRKARVGENVVFDITITNTGDVDLVTVAAHRQLGQHLPELRLGHRPPRQYRARHVDLERSRDPDPRPGPHRDRDHGRAGHNPVAGTQHRDHRPDHAADRTAGAAADQRTALRDQRRELHAGQVTGLPARAQGRGGRGGGLRHRHHQRRRRGPGHRAAVRHLGRRLPALRLRRPGPGQRRVPGLVSTWNDLGALTPSAAPTPSV